MSTEAGEVQFGHVAVIGQISGCQIWLSDRFQRLELLRKRGLHTLKSSAFRRVVEGIEVFA